MALIGVWCVVVGEGDGVEGLVVDQIIHRLRFKAEMGEASINRSEQR